MQALARRSQLLVLVRLLLSLLRQPPSPPLLPSRGRSRERAASTRHRPGSLRGCRGLLRLEVAQLGRLTVKGSLKADDVLLSKERRQTAIAGSPGSRVINRTRSSYPWKRRRDADTRKFAGQRPVGLQAEPLSTISRTASTQRQLLCDRRNTRRSGSLGTVTNGDHHELAALSAIADVPSARGYSA